jgi:signal peptidase
MDNSYFKTLGLNDVYYNSFAKPILWCGIAFLVWVYPSVRSMGKLRTKGAIHFWSFTLAVIVIAVQFVAGSIDGIGKSPYSHSFAGILSNTIIIGTVLIARETSRNYLVNSITREENYMIFIIVSLFMTLITFPTSRFTDFKTYEDLVKFIAQFLAPEFSKNLLATVLVFYGGPMSSILFMGTLDAFQWFSPILPNLKWITAALVGILTPVFLLSIVEIIYEDEAKIRSRTDKNEENPLSWIFTTLISIGVIWFSVGVFPIYPSVIATGSMIPMIQPGDIIIVDKKADANNLVKGQVIQFKRDNILISHRIVDIVDNDGVKCYKTKGDNNSGPDTELVKPQDVKGEVIKVVPKLGWPTLLFKSRNEIPIEKVQF